MPGSRGAALSLLFFCRRFLFQIKRKCRNAERRYHLIVVGRKGKGKLSTFQNCYDLVSTIVDNGYPRGLPNEVRCLKMGNPQSTGSSGGWGTDLPSPAQAAAIEKLFSFARSEPVYGSVLPEVELPTAATDMTTANTKMIPNACNTILLSSLTVS